MTRYVMRRAGLQELGIVMDLLDQRTAWLQKRGGTDQWSTRTFDEVMHTSIERGETWLLWDADQAVATITLTTVADADFWTADERRVPALYLSKLATSVKRKGQGLGALLIEWAAAYATARGVIWLRWDVWRTNEQLQAYYRALGAEHLRTLDVPGRRSGALFQSCRAARTDLGISTAATFGPIATLASTEMSLPRLAVTAEAPGQLGANADGNQLGHEFLRLVDGWRTSSLASNDLEDPLDVMVAVGRHHEPVLFDAGDGWHLHGAFSKPVAGTWPADFDPSVLRRGHVYRLQLAADRESVRVFGDLDLA